MRNDYQFYGNHPFYQISLMGFADNYFNKYKVSPPFFKIQADQSLGIIIVIPCYDDEHIFKTLTSLDGLKHPMCKIEVIVVVNSAEHTPIRIIRKNRTIYQELKEKSINNFYRSFTLLPILIENVPKKIAGVGNARKTGMDEAIRHFNSINKKDGIIVSLDADTLVTANYIEVIVKEFKNNPKHRAAVFQFQHNFDENLCSQEEIEAGRLYEIYLRYFRISLSLTGFPYNFHTIGSCFAVDAETYIKTGGMSRKQGGEDFYFLHKAAQITLINKIKDRLVSPSPRRSDRVPFGTGPAVNKIINGKEYLVYNFNLFFLLKQFFEQLIYYADTQNIDFAKIPSEIIEFTGEDNLVSALTECSNNSAIGKNLLKRIYSKFDAFFVIKFLNSFTENSKYPPQEIITSAKLLLDHYHIDYKNSNIYEQILELDEYV